jgi:6-phosphogluconolactonase
VIESFPLDETGTPQGTQSVIRNSGRPGPRTDRQDASHPHCVTLSPDGKHLYVCDLGLDRIYCYKPDHVTADLTPAEPAFTQAPPGSGPRHVAISRDGAFAYVIGELDNMLSVYARNRDTGALTLLQRIPTLPEGFDGPNTAAEVAIHPNGRFLYASNRGHDSIAIYGRDPRGGLLTPIGNVPCGGRHPRHFALSPDGDWLICANRDSNNLVSFRVNPATGALARCSTLEGIPKPTCALFVPATGTKSNGG